MPTATRVRDAAASTARLMAAAGEEFASRGFDGARVDRIAEASETNRAIMFQRFGDKAGLYRAVLAAIAEDADAVRRELVAGRSDPPDSIDEFRTLVADVSRTNLRFLAAHPTAARMLRWERASDWQVFRAVRPTTSDAAHTIVGWFRGAAERGWLRAGAPPEAQLALTFEFASSLIDVHEDFAVSVITAAMVVDGAPR